jgi:FkbM family methyltransferase
VADLHNFPLIFGEANCRYGRLIYPKGDQYVGRSLALYGEFSESEAAIFKRAVKPGDTVVEAGANLGAHTVLLARLAGGAPGGGVLAFEPQPVLHQILCANLGLNSVTNVKAERCGLGNRQQTLHIPSLDYGADYNFGGLSLGLAEDGEPVPVRRLDSYRLSKCDFIKIDVEGMERQVLEGGSNTIQDLRPLMYVENDREAESRGLIELLLSMDYALWWHLAPLYNPGNVAGNAQNVFPGIVSINMYCCPKEKLSGWAGAPVEGVEGMVSVAGPDQNWSEAAQMLAAMRTVSFPTALPDQNWREEPS